MDEELLEDLDPNAYPPQRVTINAEVSGTNTRTFNLAMMNRKVDHKNRTVAIDLATDEYLLQSYADVVDVDTRSYEANLRNLVNFVLNKAIPGAALQSGTTNANLTAYWDARNIITDPGTAATGQPAVTGYLVNQASLDINDTTWSISGDGDSYNIYNPTGTDSYLQVGAGTGSIYPGLQGGKTYVLSATANVKTLCSGSEHARSRRVYVAWWLPSGTYQSVQSVQVPNVLNTPTRLSVEFTLPKELTGIELRFYLGHTVGQIRWDGITLVERGPGTAAEDAVYFDGDTADTANYVYDWEGLQDLSASKRTAVLERLPELFNWKAGVSAWDFLQPLLGAAKLRLFCDEQRRWFLIDPADYNVPGRVTARTNNTTDGTDDMGGLSGLYATGVVVRFSWVDEDGNNQVKVDTAGVAGRVHLREENRPYPGPGMAQAILNKMKGQGRTQTVSVATEYTATPGMEIGISLPGTADQIGRLTSVNFQLNTGLMELESAGLRTTPAGAIDLLVPIIDSLPGTIDSLS
ncbi:hypothetical protein [Microbacterium sp. PRC9]|uniref:hypothetical protein n=1 Tax=Microbacterium sp. PRC9 TaxID=2962591 RepID=UPI002881FC14|nr:hypothetical protein [Microbacterium sp. PRC9]MDT0142796.1 hypothetical protein [Microbacterium sp. PRC9]